MKPPQNYIRTFTGLKVQPWDMFPKDICIEDIAHALSLICRYNGHCPAFYSVAQHSVLVAQYVRPENRAWGLLHDAAEAYLCDIPSPVKKQAGFAAYRAMEDDLLQVIAEKWHLARTIPQAVHDADRVLLSTEMVAFGREADLIGTPDLSISVVPWAPAYAALQFLTLARKLKLT